MEVRVLATGRELSGCFDFRVSSATLLGGVFFAAGLELSGQFDFRVSSTSLCLGEVYCTEGLAFGIAGRVLLGRGTVRLDAPAVSGSASPATNFDVTL